MHVPEEKFIEMSKALPKKAVDAAPMNDEPVGEIHAFLRPIQPHMSPTKEHVDALCRAIEKADQDLHERLRESTEAQKEYVDAAERLGELVEKFGRTLGR
jgi:hypothetical protein